MFRRTYFLSALTLTIISLIFLSGLIFAAPSSSNVPLYKWDRTVLSSSVDTEVMKIAVDGNDTVHAISQIAGTTYMQLTSTWVSTVTLDATAETIGISVDDQNTPHVIYANPMSMTYGTLTAGGWVTQSLGLPAENITRIETPSPDTVTFAYSNAGNLYLMRLQNNIWLRDAIPSPCSANSRLSEFFYGVDLVARDADTVGLVYGCITNGAYGISEVHYAVLSNGNWQNRLVPDTDHGIRGLELLYDIEDNPHILYGSSGSITDNNSLAFTTAKLIEWSDNGINETKQTIAFYPTVAPTKDDYHGNYSWNVIPNEAYFDSTGTLHVLYSTRTVRSAYSTLYYVGKNENSTAYSKLMDVYDNGLSGQYSIHRDLHIGQDAQGRPQIFMSYFDNENEASYSNMTVEVFNASSPLTVYLPVIFSD